VKPLTLMIRGQRWRLAFRRLKRLWGDCDYQQRLIRVDPQADDLNLLDTIIHEYLHAAQPDLSEQAVTDTASDLAGLLFRLGYRR
jgi:hypothetical protein